MEFHHQVCYPATDSGRMLEYHFQSRTSTDGLGLRETFFAAQWMVWSWWGDMEFRWEFEVKHLEKQKTSLCGEMRIKRQKLWDILEFLNMPFQPDSCFWWRQLCWNSKKFHHDMNFRQFWNYHWPKLMYQITTPPKKVWKIFSYAKESTMHSLIVNDVS